LQDRNNLEGGGGVTEADHLMPDSTPLAYFRKGKLGGLKKGKKKQTRELIEISIT